MINIYVNGEWKNATVYVYTNGEWKEAEVYVYNQQWISTERGE